MTAKIYVVIETIDYEGIFAVTHFSTYNNTIA